MHSDKKEDLESAAEFRHVSLRRGNVTALDQVDLSLPLGRTSAILGESGSGKSTLVQMINGLLRPNEGTVRTLGVDIDYRNLRSLRKRIGYAIQDVALFPHMSVRANILLPGQLHGWSEGDCAVRLAELLALMHLPEDLLDRYPHQLSGGQQQRAGICRAMMLRPELLLLDEPFSGLDAMTRQKIHTQFLEIQKHEPISSILVTHDPQEAINLADYMVVMRSGQVLQQGPVSEVVAAPADRYVEQLCTGLTGMSS